ncbi:hypothetical protein PC123_g2302 [Phytophthora cactorum]|nr:hypothetical protein PC123_g2302 [Phytophthora cactorum]
MGERRWRKTARAELNSRSATFDVGGMAASKV